MFACRTPPRSFYPKKDRIIVIGDLHADYDMTLRLFKKLKLVDNHLNWIALPKDTCVVQLGDQIDGGGRGGKETTGEMKLVEFMETINEKAKMVGGAVISLIGNHEIMNLIGDFRFSSKNDIADMGGIELREKIFKPGGDLFNKLSCTRNVIVKIGSWMFVHAGVLPKHVDEQDGNSFIENMNNLMKLFLQGKKNPTDTDIQKYFLSPDGIIWNREYGSQEPSCKKWDSVSKLLGVGSMVVGHTIQNNINGVCDDKIWRVDVGMSSTFGTDKIQALEILDDGVSLPKNKFKPISIIQ